MLLLVEELIFEVLAEVTRKVAEHLCSHHRKQQDGYQRSRDFHKVVTIYRSSFHLKFRIPVELMPSVLFDVQPIEQVFDDPHDMLALEELFAFQAVLLEIPREVVQDERIHEIDDILYVVAGSELPAAAFLLVAFVEALCEQYHEHEEFVKEAGVQLSPIDLHKELA